MLKNRYKITRRKMRNLYNETKHSNLGGVYFDEKENRYIRYYSSDVMDKKTMKRITNRKARKTTLVNGNLYRRVHSSYDYS